MRQWLLCLETLHTPPPNYSTYYIVHTVYCIVYTVYCIGRWGSNLTYVEQQGVAFFILIFLPGRNFTWFLFFSCCVCELFTIKIYKNNNLHTYVEGKNNKGPCGSHYYYMLTLFFIKCLPMLFFSIYNKCIAYSHRWVLSPLNANGLSSFLAFIV